MDDPASVNAPLLPPLFFFHNPKAGGTAVLQALTRFYPADRCCPLIENSQRDHERLRGRYSGFAGFAFYAGHYGYDIYASVAQDHRAVTCFREPLARLVSLYAYFRHNVPAPRDIHDRDNLYPVLAAQNMSFDDFVTSEDPRIEVHTRNHHVRQLTASAWDVGSTGDLRQAKDMLAAMPWFYIAEQGKLCQAWAESVFAPHRLEIGRVNVTTLPGEAMAPIRAATRRRIDEKNELDHALYNAAMTRLARAL